MKYRVEFDVELHAKSEWEVAELQDWIENDSVDFILTAGLWGDFSATYPEITRLD